MKLDLSDFLLAEIAVVDPDGMIAHCNRKWEETARIGALSPKQPGWNYIAECEAAIQRSCSEAAAIRAGLLAVLKSDLPSFVATYACPFNGLHHWFQVLISAFEFDGKRHAILMHVDVSPLQRDPLTGLPNRAMFDAQLDLALSLARDIGRQTGVIIADMNKLKLINDMYGHRIGDEALKALAAELKKMAGPDCMAARIGGDERCGPSGLLRYSVRAANARSLRIRDHLLNRSCGQSHIHFRERRNRALSRRRHDRHRASRISRQVDVRAEAWLIGRLGATSG